MNAHTRTHTYADKPSDLRSTGASTSLLGLAGRRGAPRGGAGCPGRWVKLAYAAKSTESSSIVPRSAASAFVAWFTLAGPRALGWVSHSRASGGAPPQAPPNREGKDAKKKLKITPQNVALSGWRFYWHKLLGPEESQQFISVVSWLPFHFGSFNPANPADSPGVQAN